MASFALLLVAALIVRALIPQGYMIEQDEAGGIVVSICGANANWVVPMKHGEHDPQEDGQPASSACAFASMHTNATPPEGTATPELPQVSVAVYDALRQRALSPIFPASLPPATGPPLTV